MKSSNNDPTIIRKTSVSEELIKPQAYRKVLIHHKTNSGDTSIDLHDITPVPELLTKGFSNPSSSDISNMNLMYNRKNVEIYSNLRGQLQRLSFYFTTNMQIRFDGWVSSGDAIEIWFHEVISAISPIANVDRVTSTKVLLDGEDEIVTKPFECNLYPETQMGAVQVYRGPSATLQLRCVDNIITNEGNYIEIGNGTGITNRIKFKTAAIGDENIIVIGQNVVQDSSKSTISLVEGIQGDVDKMKDVLEATSGVDRSNFDDQPMSVDVASFGEKVNAMAGQIESQLSKINSILNTEIFTEQQIYSARIDASSGTPIITSTNGSFISSITDNGVGDYRVNFSIPLTVAPAITGTANDNNRLLNVSGTVTTTYVDIRIYAQATDALIDAPFSITLTKQGADAQQPTKIKDLI